MPKAKPQLRFQQFLMAYPLPRRKSGAPAQQAFRHALRKVPFAFMLHALEQHKRSVQWQDPRFIPSMTTWLDEERWIQTLPEPVVPKARRTPFEQARHEGLKKW